MSYVNSEPIDDPMVVLDLLVEGWNDRTSRQIDRFPHWPPHVAIDHYSGGYERHSGTDRYLITAGVIERLLAARYIRGTPQWGYTEMRELVATDAGKNALYATRDALGEFPRSTSWFREGARLSRAHEWRGEV